MTGQAFMAYMRARMPARSCDDDPHVEFYDGRTRIADNRGGEMNLERCPTRVLRALAQQLDMVADEIDRRGFEERVA